MSTYYDLYCKDCDEYCDLGDVRNKERLADLWADGDKFAPLASVDLDDGVIGNAHTWRITWFAKFCAKHRYHEVVVHDEYERYERHDGK